MLLLLLPAALPSALAWSLRTPRPVMHLSEYALFSGRLAEPKLQATAVELALAGPELQGRSCLAEAQGGKSFSPQPGDDHPGFRT